MRRGVEALFVLSLASVPLGIVGCGPAIVEPQPQPKPEQYTLTQTETQHAIKEAQQKGNIHDITVAYKCRSDLNNGNGAYCGLDHLDPGYGQQDYPETSTLFPFTGYYSFGMVTPLPAEKVAKIKWAKGAVRIETHGKTEYGKLGLLSPYIVKNDDSSNPIVSRKNDGKFMGLGIATTGNDVNTLYNNRNPMYVIELGIDHNGTTVTESHIFNIHLDADTEGVQRHMDDQK